MSVEAYICIAALAIIAVVAVPAALQRRNVRLELYGLKVEVWDGSKSSRRKT